MVRKLQFWLPAIIWALIIFLLSSRPSVQASRFILYDFLLKKTAHFIEYFVLATLIYRSLRNTAKISKSNLYLASVVLAVLYAISDEIHQTFIPTREGRIRDVIIDSAGIAFAISVINFYLPRSPSVIRKIAKKFKF